MRTIGRYEVHELIAAGGMGAVYFGRMKGEAGFSRAVAIKCMRATSAEDTSSFVSMFIDEARLASRVRHPNVVQTLDVVAEEGNFVLVMEYVHGESLARLARPRDAPPIHIPPPIAVAILTGVLHGLHAAHEAHGEDGAQLAIIHRDVSPQNVMVGIDGVPLGDAEVCHAGVTSTVVRIRSGPGAGGRLRQRAPPARPIARVALGSGFESENIEQGSFS